MGLGRCDAYLAPNGHVWEGADGTRAALVTPRDTRSLATAVPGRGLLAKTRWTNLWTEQFSVLAVLEVHGHWCACKVLVQGCPHFSDSSPSQWSTSARLLQHI